jgi:hypothetical protein
VDLKTLLRALEFYSKLKRWKAPNGNFLDSICLKDQGFTARKVLKEFYAEKEMVLRCCKRWHEHKDKACEEIEEPEDIEDW